MQPAAGHDRPATDVRVGQRGFARDRVEDALEASALFGDAASAAAPRALRAHAGRWRGRRLGPALRFIGTRTA